MKVVRNDRASYITRAIKGGAKSSNSPSVPKVGNRSDFVVDQFGYFVWTTPVASLDKKRR